MNKELGGFLKQLSLIVFLVISFIVLLLFFTNSDKGPFSLNFCIGAIIGVFLMLLPMYVAGEIVVTLHENVDILTEILNKLDNWKNE